MSRRRIATTIVVGIMIPVTVAAVVVYSEFFSHQPLVRALIVGLPAVERNLPPNVEVVLARLDDEQVNLWVARNLLQEVAMPSGMARWNLRFSLWTSLVPRVYSRQVRVSLFAHYLLASDAAGLEAVSHSVFGKPPHLLTEREVIGLLAVTKSPSRYSPHEHPEAYRAEVERLSRQLGRSN